MLAGRVMAGEPRLTGGLVVGGLGAQTCPPALATRCVAAAWRHLGRISMARGAIMSPAPRVAPTSSPVPWPAWP